MKIEALKPFTLRDSSTGDLASVGCNQVVTVSDELGASLISDGLAKEFTLITPTGTKDITANGETDVTAYAKALVAVPLPEGSTTLTANGEHNIADYASVVVDVPVYTVAYNANGGTGTIDSVHAANGSSITLSDGTGLTAPDTKRFAGWGSTNDKTEPDVVSPYTVSGNVTLYAVWVDATP